MTQFYMGFFAGILAAVIIFYLGVVFSGVMLGKSEARLLPTKVLRRAYGVSEKKKPIYNTDEKAVMAEKVESGELKWGDKDG